MKIQLNQICWKYEQGLKQLKLHKEQKLGHRKFIVPI